MKVVDTTTWEYQLGFLLIQLGIGAFVERLPRATAEATLAKLRRNRSLRGRA